MKLGVNKKRKRFLHGGPYNGKITYLSGEASTTLTFGIGNFYGRYVGSAFSSNMNWQQMKPS